MEKREEGEEELALKYVVFVRALASATTSGERCSAYHRVTMCLDTVSRVSVFSKVCMHA